MKILKTVAIVSIAGIIGTMVLNAEEIKDRGACSGKKEMMQGHKGKHKQMRKVLKQLDLTDEQKTTLKADREAMKEERKAMREVRKASGGIGQFISVNGVDREALTAEITKRATTRANMKADKIEKIMTVLTDEQKTKFVTLMQSENK